MTNGLGRNSLFLRKTGGFAVFVSLAALLWLMIQLSATYNEVVPVQIKIKDIPTGKIIKNDGLVINAAVKCSGFRLCRYYLLPKDARYIEISLDETDYFENFDSTYSLDEEDIEKAIGSFMGIDAEDVFIDSEEIAVEVGILDERKVPLVPDITLKLEPQYCVYGTPVASQDSIVIYGDKSIIEDIDEIKTVAKTYEDVSDDIFDHLEIDLNKLGVKSALEGIDISIRVERFTEYSVDIPILNTLKNTVILPDKVNIRYFVAMKDFTAVNAAAFLVELDTACISDGKIPVAVRHQPEHTKIMSIKPEIVEYIIMGTND